MIITGQSSPNLACAVQVRGEFEIQHRAFQPPQHEFASLDDALLEGRVAMMLRTGSDMRTGGERRTMAVVPVSQVEECSCQSLPCGSGLRYLTGCVLLCNGDGSPEQMDCTLAWGRLQSSFISVKNQSRHDVGSISAADRPNLSSTGSGCSQLILLKRC